MAFMIFFVTVPNLDKGKEIALALVKNKLAACVNIVQNVISIYKWKGNVEEDGESLLIIKTKEEKSDLLIKKINELHNYEIPECIGFKIEKGSDNYLNWIRENVE